jgi:primosomal protein N' (replication factor Y)
LPEAGYAAALLLDTWALLGRLDLRANEETLRRWMTAAALVRPAADGGQVVVVADASLRTVQALVRWDPVGHAARELEDRIDVGLPPAQRVAVLTGTSEAVSDLLNRVELPSTAGVLGPTPFDDGQVRTLIRVPRASGVALAKALRRAAGERSARKEQATVNIHIDPQELG